MPTITFYTPENTNTPEKARRLAIRSAHKSVHIPANRRPRQRINLSPPSLLQQISLDKGCPHFSKCSRPDSPPVKVMRAAI